jgi:hypothetical protein
MSLEHLTSKKLKEILTGKPDEVSIKWAIDYTKKCVASDESNEAVPYHVVQERKARLALAEEMFSRGVPTASSYFLKKTWEV